MANFGVRILDKTEQVIKFRLVLLNPDYYQFPRTHAFGLFILWEGLKRKGWGGNALLAEFLSQQYIIGDFRAKAPVAVSRMEVGNFRNLRDPSRSEKIRPRMLPDGSGFEGEENLPSADYELELRMPAFASHLEAGMLWESDGKEMDDMRHYLELRNEAGVHFIDSSMDGKWHVIRQGKEGGEPEIVRNRTANFQKVVDLINARLSEGYTLIYKNFDTPFGIEVEMLRELED